MCGIEREDTRPSAVSPNDDLWLVLIAACVQLSHKQRWLVCVSDMQRDVSLRQIVCLKLATMHATTTKCVPVMSSSFRDRVHKHMNSACVYASARLASRQWYRQHSPALARDEPPITDVPPVIARARTRHSLQSV